MRCLYTHTARWTIEMEWNATIHTYIHSARSTHDYINSMKPTEHLITPEKILYFRDGDIYCIDGARDIPSSPRMYKAACCRELEDVHT